MTLMMVPAVLLGNLTGRDPQIFAAIINAFLIAATVGVAYLTSLRLGLRPGQATVVALMIGLASLLLPFAQTMFAEPGVGLAVAVGLCALANPRPSYRDCLLVGAAAGFAVIMRNDSLILVLPALVLGLVLRTRRWDKLAVFAAGILPFLIVVGAYNQLRFGSPLTLSYGNQPFNHPVLSGLYGLLLSPGRGLLFFVPLVIVAALGTWWAWRRDHALTIIAVLLLFTRLPFYAGWWAWGGGTTWGPRFLVPGMPALAIGLAEVVRRVPRMRWLTVVAAVGTAASLAVQLTGAFFPAEDSTAMRALNAQLNLPLGSAFIAQATRPAVEAQVDDSLFSWRNALIPDAMHQLVVDHDSRSNVFSASTSGTRKLLEGGVTAAGAAMVGTTALAVRRRAKRQES
jgi:hypothetical protein